MKNLYGLILAGGSGTRLWPISRDYYPKQFLKLTGDETLIQQTFLRLKSLIPPEKIYLTTNRIFVDEIINQLKKYGFHKNNVIIQPADKNTGPAIAQATAKIHEKDKSAIIVNCPSDHIIKPKDKFFSSLKIGYKLSQKGYLVTLGIKPTTANTEYGYIFPNKSVVEIIKGQKTYKAGKFIEKPKSNKARSLIKNGSLWNSGIFIWQAKTILDEYKKIKKIVYNSIDSNKKYFSLKPSAIDTDILEISDKVWVVPSNFTWSDIGSWKALYELLDKDSEGNILNKRVVSLNSKGSLIYGTEDRTIAAINLKDLIIIDTKDSILIANRENVHEIKAALQIAKTKGLGEETQKPLVSIITPVLNGKDFIGNSMLSVFNQNYKNIEYIVIDGGSTDGTLRIINKYRYKIEHFLSKPGASNFEMINKGIEQANGEIIGILDTNNSYIDNEVIASVVRNLNKSSSKVCWGDVVYTKSKLDNRVAMYWKSSNYKKGLFKTGWFPPFPALFVKKSIYKRHGGFNTKFQIAADYELMLRLLEKKNIKSSYIPQILTKMTGKGLTVKSILDRITGNIETYQSWKENKLKIKPTFLFFKYFNRVHQIFKKNDL